MKRIQKVISTCALCRQPRLLRDSHVIPRGCYLRARGRRRDPVLDKSPVNIANGRAFQSQQQLKAELLCSECEARLNKGGERYFLQNCIQQDERFPIYEVIQANLESSIPMNADTRYWHAEGLHADYAKLAFFAASVFWRFAMARTKFRSGTLTLELPDGLEAALRDYLTGSTNFIKNSAITVHAVRRLPPGAVDLRRTFISPRELPTDCFSFPLKFYELECLGFVFFLLYAEGSSAGYLKSSCILQDENHPIYLSNIIRESTVGRLINWARKSQPTEKLAQTFRLVV